MTWYMKIPMGRPEWCLIDIFFSLAGPFFLKKRPSDVLNKWMLEVIRPKDVIFTDLGRQAIYISLKSLSLDPSDEVIIPTFACQNVILPVLSAGLRPVFADIGPDLNICIDHVKTLINKNTKAIIVPHLYGKAAQIEAFEDLTKSNGIILIDDAAQAFGARINNRYLGTYGKFGIFSFGPFKSMTGTRGGALIINENVCYPDVKGIRIQPYSGSSPVNIALKAWVKLRLRKYSYRFLSKISGNLIKPPNRQNRQLNFKETAPEKMSELNAAILTRVFGKTNQVINKRIENAKCISSLIMQNDQYFHKPKAFNDNIFVKYIIVIKKEYHHKRKEFLDYLKTRGIEAHDGYFPLHLQSIFSGYAKGKLPLTEHLWRGVVCLPCDAAMTNNEINYMAKTINNFNWGKIL